MLKKYDVVTIDDALVDEFYACTDADLTARPLPRHMRHNDEDKRNLLEQKGKTLRTDDPEEAEAFVKGLTYTQKSAGGGGANTLAVMRHHGSKTAFCGKLGTGTHAEYFRNDLKKTGIDCYEMPSNNPLATGVCKIFVTPDSERTMLALLPNQVHITPADVDAHAGWMLDSAKILFTQAYRWTPESRDGFRHAFNRVHAAGGKVAFSLSAPFCVENNREDFLSFITKGVVDILFANKNEIEALYPGKTLSEISTILQTNTAAPGACKTVVLTFGPRGSKIIHQGKSYDIPAAHVGPDKIVDATGAGDAYAAGVLYGITHGKTMAASGALGSAWAAKIIQHYGTRPTKTSAIAL